MKVFGLACLISAVAAVAVPGNDWKDWQKCPAPVTVTATVTATVTQEKVVKQPFTEYQTVTQTQYATVTATETMTATVTETKKEVQTVTQVEYKTAYQTVTVTQMEEKVCPTPVCQTSSKWGDWN